MRASAVGKWLAVVLVLATSMFAQAAAANDTPPPVDPPARVGRVSEFAGTLYLAPSEPPAEWQAIGRNHPVTTGNSLWISQDGRVEVDFGTGQFRLAGNSTVYVARLDDDELTLVVPSGRVIVRLRVLDSGEVARIDAPNATIRLNRPGLYRVDVDADVPMSRITVREGDADLSATSGVETVGAGQSLVATGSDHPQLIRQRASGPDGFDTWSDGRDEHYAAAAASGYVSGYMVGAADLYRYGYWQTHVDYGYIWYPTGVAVGWAPYRYGRWVWVPPWGWTWVDDAPWGFAPFHYGRWVWAGGRWGWCPGQYVARPFYAPALVAWYGGAGWSMGIGVGAPVYGWVPLGWREPYWPHYRVSDRYWHAVNRPYAVNYAERPKAPPTRYANYAVPGAITAVPNSVFHGGRPVAPNAISARPSTLAGMPLTAPPLHKPRQVEAAPPVRGTPPAPSGVGRARPATPFAPGMQQPAGPGALSAPAAPRGSIGSARPGTGSLPGSVWSTPSVPGTAPSPLHKPRMTAPPAAAAPWSVPTYPQPGPPGVQGVPMPPGGGTGPGVTPGPRPSAPGAAPSAVPPGVRPSTPSGSAPSAVGPARRDAVRPIPLAPPAGTAAPEPSVPPSSAPGAAGAGSRSLIPGISSIRGWTTPQAAPPSSAPAPRRVWQGNTWPGFLDRRGGWSSPSGERGGIAPASPGDQPPAPATPGGGPSLHKR